MKRQKKVDLLQSQNDIISGLNEEGNRGVISDDLTVAWFSLKTYFSLQYVVPNTFSTYWGAGDEVYESSRWKRVIITEIKDIETKKFHLRNI